MAGETFYKGEEQILYLVIGGIDCPIACLTDNSFSESVEELDTTTVDNAGWKTSVPLNQGYSITFSGVQIVTAQSDPPTRYSLDALRVIKRSRTRFIWKIGVDGIFEQTGEGYITELSESSPVDGNLTFTGKIIGYGAPTITDVDDNVYVFQDDNVYTFND